MAYPQAPEIKTEHSKILHILLPHKVKLFTKKFKTLTDTRQEHVRKAMLPNGSRKKELQFSICTLGKSRTKKKYQNTQKCWWSNRLLYLREHGVAPTKSNGPTDTDDKDIH